MVKVEEERLVAYYDTNGTLTISVGHTGELDPTQGHLWGDIRGEKV
jgi:hypothetical protein